MVGSKRLVHWTNETWWKCEKCRSSTGLPPLPPHSNRYGPYGILVVCRINLWPAVRMELGQEGWLKQPVAKIRGPIMAGDQGSRRGHHCSKTVLTGNHGFKVWVAPPGQTAAPCGGKQTVSPLDQWDMVAVWEMQELHNIIITCARWQAHQFLAKLGNKSQKG
jgi:hypothetical protein